MARAALRELLGSIYFFDHAEAHAQGEGHHHKQSLPGFAEGLSGEELPGQDAQRTMALGSPRI